MNGVPFDTNALLFMVSRSERVAARVGSLEQLPRFVSQVCAIEIATKLGLGKLALPPPFHTGLGHAFHQAVVSLGADILQIDVPHIESLAHLPLHHRDPFDRLIIAQALAENLTDVTRDRSFALYPGLDVYEI